MFIVGEHLAETALQKTNESDRDLFARSAFNRYYYAVYFVVLENITEINPDWGTTKHSKLPELLTNPVIRIIKNDLKKKVNKKVITRKDGESLKYQVIHAANELSNLLIGAYSVRVTADYKPDIKVKVNNQVIELDGKKISDAKHWKNKAEQYSISIIEAYKDVGII